MPVTLQVMYPITDDTHFDYDYYVDTHLKIVGEHLGAFIDRTLVTKGVAGGPDTPPGFYAIASIVFPTQDAMDAAMAASGPVMGDLPNFTNVQPTLLIGDVIG